MVYFQISFQKRKKEKKKKFQPGPNSMGMFWFPKLRPVSLWETLSSPHEHAVDNKSEKDSNPDQQGAQGARSSYGVFQVEIQSPSYF